jgi:serpin B
MQDMNARGFASLALAASIVLALASPALAGDEGLRATAQGNSEFALALYGKLKDQPGNLFFSPFSVSAALAMTMAGARGNTEKEMAEVLRLGLARDRLHPAMGALIRDLNGRVLEERRPGDPDGEAKPFELVVANALWGQAGYPFRPEFKELMAKNYEAGFREADFAGDAEKARLDVNAWVEEKTAKRIRDILEPGALTPATRLVLANAVYFKAAWEDPFEKEATRPGDFLVSGKETVRVSFMNRSGTFAYAETPELQVLWLPYRGRDLAMAVLLPRAGEGLAAIEKKLDAKALQGWTSAARHEEVDVSLPKFRIESCFQLGGTLQEMGVKDAFSGVKADFTGMAEKHDLSIALVIHKSFVDVNEAGTEAAAATVVALKSEGEPEAKPKTFRADRPFLFAIVDRKTDSVLFVGRVANPAK